MQYEIWRLLMIKTGDVYTVLSLEFEELIQTAFYFGDQELNLNRLMPRLISRLITTTNSKLSGMMPLPTAQKPIVATRD
jgi:hypothetical protein